MVQPPDRPSGPAASKRERWVRRGLAAAGALAVAYVVLLVPDFGPPPVEGAGGTPFAWDADAKWASLERDFDRARARGCAAESPAIDAALASIEARIASIEAQHVGPADPSLAAIERELFEVAPRFGACPARAPELVDVYLRMREAVKDQSIAWDASSREVRERLYRLLYGGRAAIEELLLQMPRDAAPAVTLGRDEPSATPFAVVRGVKVHSGDILVSRGGAPTSALIARGSDFPGNFSHVALAHVAEDGTVSIIESHIESGVGVSTLETYLGDRKLRILVLRPRADLPQIREDATLPHRAATAALEAARERHIAYDFAMDHRDPSEQFCSEVVSSVYGERGVRLWEGLTQMSSRGVTRWLAAFGVRHFETHGPSDLEYDPKLVVVAEWHDAGALWDDHVDNAVIDAMLEGAERGDELDYDTAVLPLARVAKAWSVLLNLFGAVGPVPEGMSAATALRAESLGERHGAIRARVIERAARFERERGYRPPYWELVKIAREAAR